LFYPGGGERGNLNIPIIGRGAPVCAPVLLPSLLKEGLGVVGFAGHRGCRPTASIPGYMPASRRDATAEPGGFTAISRWSSEAIPPVTGKILTLQAEAV